MAPTSLQDVPDTHPAMDNTSENGATKPSLASLRPSRTSTTDQNMSPTPTTDPTPSNPTRTPSPAGASDTTTTASTAQAPAYTPLQRSSPKLTLTLNQLLLFLGVGWLEVVVLLLTWLKPGVLTCLKFGFVGLGAGLAYSYLYYRNRRTKAEINQVMSTDVGAKGLQHLLGQLPSWITNSEKEKVEWLNSVLLELWPWYDKAISRIVKEQVGNLLNSYKPPGVIHKIGFKEVTFGDAPFRIEGIKVDEDEHQVKAEIDIRWAGDANITLAIDMLPGAGEATRLCPKVADIMLVATLQVTLKPLLPKIPPFGALIISLKGPPRIKYYLDFGKALGSSYSGAAIKGVVQGIVDSVLMNMLVWPKRLVIPMSSDPEVLRAVDRYMLKPHGMVRVTVERAEGVRAMDIGGKSDPQVDLYTDAEHVMTTSVQENTLAPVWNETFYAVVQEPQDQLLYLSMSDISNFNAKELLKLNVFKGVKEAVHNKEFMARAMIKLDKVTKEEGQVVTEWLHLGKGEFRDPDGPGRGEGRIMLKMCYQALESIREEDMKRAATGTLLVSIIRMANILPPDRIPKKRNGQPKDKSKWPKISTYVKFKLAGKKCKTQEVVCQGEHVFTHSNKFQFDDVSVAGPELTVELLEVASSIAALGQKQSLGSTSVDMVKLTESRDKNTTLDKNICGYSRRLYTLENGDDAVLEIEMQFVPHF